MIIENISRKALELGISKFDISITKEAYNGVNIKTLNKDKAAQIKELTRWISQNEYRQDKKPIRQRKILTKKM